MSYLGFCPPGVVFTYAGSTAPDGWLLCDGQDYATTIYPALAAVLGTTYNTQVNPTTGTAYAAPSAGRFRVPDYRGSFLRGVGTASGADVTTLGGHQVQKTAKNGLALTGSLSSTAASLVGSISSTAASLNGSVSGGTASLTGTTSFASSAHSHSLLRGSGQSNYLVVRGVASGGNDVLIQSQNQNTESRTGDTGSNSASASVGLSSTGAGNGTLSVSGGTASNGTLSVSGGTASIGSLAIATGDNETRPINKGVNYIIKI